MATLAVVEVARIIRAKIIFQTDQLFRDSPTLKRRNSNAVCGVARQHFTGWMSQSFRIVAFVGDGQRI